MIVHQTLHGYADGHRLLASSTPLSTENQHLIALLSDISGHSAGVTFEHYLSGYPVRHDLFALARTWQAREVSRPGSVWTQTLLIQTDELAAVRDVQPLLDLFRRPEGGDWLPYSTPLDLPPEYVDRDRAMPVEVARSMVAQMVAALYDPAQPKPVRVVTDDQARWVPIALSCWLQQWPTLRPAFTFCTFALGSASLNGVPFALQIVPREAAATPAAPGSVTIETDDREDAAVPDAAWLQAALNDLGGAGADDSLRAFLRHFGDDLGADRTGFARLADIFAHLSTMPSALAGRGSDAGLSREGVQWATRSVALVADRFPADDSAGRLKRALFGGATAPEPLSAGFSEAEALLGLAITKGFTAFDARSLGLKERATRLLETNAATAGRVMQAALEVGLNPLGETSLGALLSGSAGPRVATAVARNLRLAASPGIWASSPESRHAIWRAVRQAEPPDDATSARVVYAMLDAGCDDVASDAIAYFGATGARAALAWLAAGADGGRTLGEAWTQALAQQPAVLLQSLFVDGAPLGSFGAVADALDPSGEAVEKIPMETWVRAATTVGPLTPDPVDFKAFLLAIALDHTGSEPASIAVETFQSVYDAARAQQLSGSAWMHLQTRLPRVFRQWDHCERLRRGVAVRFARGDWPMTELPRVVRGEITLDLLLRHCLETQAGRTFVDRVVRGAPRPIRWADSQRAVVDRFVSRAGTG